MMSSAEWLSLVLVCLLGAMSPGPSLVLVARQSVVNSRRHGVITAWCHSGGIGAYAFATALGLSALLTSHPGVFSALAVSGAFYLIWLGVATWRHADSGEGTPARRDGDGALGRAALQGFLTAVLNPKVAVFFLALFSQFLAPGMGPVAALALSATALAVDGLWYTLVAVVLSRAGWVGRVRGAGYWIDRITAVVLVLLGVYALLRSGGFGGAG